MKPILAAGLVSAVMVCQSWSQVEERVVVSAGAFTVRNGLSSTSIQGGYYFSLEPDQFYEIGGELQYRTFRTAVYSVPDVEVTSISVPGIIALKILKPPVVPYVGFGVLLGISFFEKSTVESRRPITVTDNVASSYGAMLVGGVRAHFESGLCVFGEYRYGWDSFTTQLDGDRSSVQQGGSWLIVGLGVNL